MYVAYHCYVKNRSTVPRNTRFYLTVNNFAGTIEFHQRKVAKGRDQAPLETSLAKATILSIHTRGIA